MDFARHKRDLAAIALYKTPTANLSLGELYRLPGKVELRPTLKSFQVRHYTESLDIEITNCIVWLTDKLRLAYHP